MPRLKAIIHPYFGRIPVNTRECETCGTPAGQPCYFQCPQSPAFYTPEQERQDALEAEAEIAAVGFQAWDSAQHRAHGLPCPYDGYDPMFASPPCQVPGVTYVPDPPAWPDDDELPF